MLLKFSLLNTCCNTEWISNQEMVHHIEHLFSLKILIFLIQLKMTKKWFKIEYLLHVKYKSYKINFILNVKP
jgi:hypothetical protein